MTFSTKHRQIGISIVAFSVAIILVMGSVGPLLNQAYAETSVGGQAIGVSISSPLGSSTLMNTGSLASIGGEISAKPIKITTPIVSADGLLSVAMGTSQSESQSALGNLVLLPGDPNEITAYFTMAKSVASCSGVSGYSDITSLTLAGKQIQVTGQPNQVVTVPGVLTLTINEQTVKSNSITVNALHLHTELGTDVIISSASSSVSCPVTLNPVQAAFGWVSSSPGCTDFATGGGWVKPPPNKGTFGFVAGYENGQSSPSGNFTYNDHTYGFDLNATDVLYYHCGPYDNSRVFGGDAVVNNQTGYCYQVYAQDNGEPGDGVDYYSVFIWGPQTNCPADGSAPSGPQYYATGNYLGGGNIELHSS